MSLNHPRYALAVLLIGAAAFSSTSEARKLGELDFQPCSLQNSMSATTVSGQCATLKVAENPAQPKGRQIELALA